MKTINYNINKQSIKYIALSLQNSGSSYFLSGADLYKLKHFLYSLQI